MNLRAETPVTGLLIEVIEIYADDSTGMRLYIPLEIRYDPQKMTTEQGIIQAFKSNARSFDELAIEMGWRNGYWTYPNNIAGVLPVNYRGRVAKNQTEDDG